MAGLRPCKECGMNNLWISWSALRAHSECKQKGMLQRAGKSNPLANTRVFFPGSVTDRVVRNWLNDDPESHIGAMPGMVEGLLEAEKVERAEKGEVVAWWGKDDRAQVIETCIEAVTKIEPALLKLVTPYEYVADYRFKVPVDVQVNGTEINRTVVLNGAMDILVLAPQDRWYVFDVKHTKDNYYYKKTAGQMLFYDLAVELQFGKAAEATALLQPLCKEMVKHIPTTSSERMQIMQRIANMANDIWAGETPPREDNTMCTMCPVRHACSKFEPILINGKNRVAF